MEQLQSLHAALVTALPHALLRQNEPMARHTTFCTGGPAALWLQPDCAASLAQAMVRAREHAVQPVLLGAGSNVLAPDEGLDTLVIQTRGMSGASAEGNVLFADCGVSLRRLATLAQSHALTGLEFAHGIPGTLGGGLFMNAGAYGGELKDAVLSVTALLPDGTITTLNRAAMDFGYRHSALASLGAVALSAKLELHPGDADAIAARMAELQAKRSASQPLDLPSAGSTFKRPTGGYAAALIDQAGLKGLTIGGAQVSEKHAGFVINRGGARSADILALIAEIQRRVELLSGIRLEPEIRILPRYKGGIPWNF